MAVHIDGAPALARLRMLRYEAKDSANSEKLTRDHIQLVRSRSHTAASQVIVNGERIALTQEFREGDSAARRP